MRRIAIVLILSIMLLLLSACSKDSSYLKQQYESEKRFIPEWILSEGEGNMYSIAYRLNNNDPSDYDYYLYMLGYCQGYNMRKYSEEE